MPLGRAQKVEYQHKLSGKTRPRLRQTAHCAYALFLNFDAVAPIPRC